MHRNPTCISLSNDWQAKTSKIGVAGRYLSTHGFSFDELTDYLLICTDTPEEFEETYGRALAIAEIFDLKNLHPAMLVKFHIIAAQGYIMLDNTNRALEILEEYVGGLVTGDIYPPLKLKGDAYFNLLDEWIHELDLGSALPRDEKLCPKVWLTVSSITLPFHLLLMNIAFRKLQKN